MALQKKSFSDIITFSRPSDATRYNASGLIERVPANAPRFDYDPLTKMARGLLIEETRTNLRTSSHMRDWSNGGSGTVFPGNVMAPDGSMDGLTVANTPGAGSFINKAFTAPEGIYTHSVFVKPLDGQPFTLVMSEMKGVGNISFNAVSKTFSGGAPRDKGFQEYSNGWIRVWVVTESAAQTSTTLYIGAYGSTNNPNLGAVWGYQVELGAFPTSYIPTLDAQVTRAAEVAAVDTLSPWYNPAEGTLYFEFSYMANGAQKWIGLLSGSSSAGLLIQGNGGSQGGVFDAGDNYSGYVYTPGKVERAAMAYTLNPSAMQYCAGGGPISGVSTNRVPKGVTRVGIGSYFGTNRFINGHIRSLKYFPRRLSNSELQAITV